MTKTEIMTAIEEVRSLRYGCVVSRKQEEAIKLLSMTAAHSQIGANDEEKSKERRQSERDRERSEVNGYQVREYPSDR